MALDVLCIGHAAYDIYFPLDFFPQENNKYKTDVFLESVGGPASNAAYLLGRWDVPTGFAGRIGEDPYGNAVLEDFRCAGVDTTLVELQEGFHTPLSCIINNTRNGSRTILNRRKDDGGVHFDREKCDFLESLARSGHPPRFLLFDSHAYEASLHSLDLFPGAVSVLDAGSLRPASKDLAGMVTHLICSESFAASMTGMSRIETDDEKRRCAEALRKVNGSPGAVTLGGRGCVFWDEAGLYALEAFPAEAVDTTGAGDIFHGAFVFGCWEGQRFSEALVFASAAAALSTEKQGGRDAIPGLDEVRTLVKSRSLQPSTL